MAILANLIVWTNDTFGKLGSLGLFLVAFMESSFFPVPPDLLLIAFALADPGNALWFALITTLGSVSGGSFGYLVGYYGEQAVLSKFFAKEKIERVHKLFNKYEFWTIFIAGFTPLPYKLFAISAGVFYINFKKFVIASFFSRGLRFSMEAIIIIFYGESILQFFDTRFNLSTFFIVVLVVLVFYIIKKIRSKRARAL